MHGVTRHLPWGEFDRLIEELGTGADERGFDSKSHLMAMLFAQFSKAGALRDVEAGMASHADRLYHLGITPAVRSTLADANRNRDSRLFSGLFARMIGRLDRGQRRSLAETTYLLDATAIPLPAHAARWARFSATTCGVKLHVIYDAGAERPIYAAVTASNVNDITAAHEMPIEAGATYVFDLGYYDYAWWARLDEAQCRIVTRFKKNTPLQVVEELELPAGSTLLSDRIGFLPTRQSVVADRTRWRMRCARSGYARRRGSCCASSPTTWMHRRRRSPSSTSAAGRSSCSSAGSSRCWISDTSSGAPRMRCGFRLVALIVFLLLRFAQATQRIVISPLEFARLIRRTLMDRRTITDLRRPPETALRICIDQLVLL